MVLAPSLIAAVGILLLGYLVIDVAESSLKGKNPRNGSYGIRTRETKKSDVAWSEGHKKAAPILKSTGIVSIGIAAVLIVVAIFLNSYPIFAIIVGALGYIVILAGLIRAAIVANSAARRINGLFSI
ncbi:MAG: SdpI family protein [Corynebacterium variabile]|uniref:SdpI family protein n=1 Tax=Corynebacterium variabile TaxID=1727 RepID=UPI003F925760